MKTSVIRTLALIAALAIPAAHASDIDIFGGVGGSAKPNILIIVDNTSSNDANWTSACTAAVQSGFHNVPSPALPSSTLLDMVYCSLYGAVDAINDPANTALLSKFNIALMSGGSGSNKGGQFYLPASSPYNPVLMDASGITTFENAIEAGIPKATGNAKLDGDMTEAWAWFTGNTGPRSGTSYSAHIGTLSCQKSFIILIGAAAKQGRPCNGSGCGTTSDFTTAGWTAAQQVQISTTNLGPNTADDGSYIDEWARYFFQTDFNNNTNDRQNIVTYTIAAGGTDPDYTQLLKSTANQGGGKAFVGADYNSIKQALLQIFNEVAAVNSVFASSSLPISSNGQGTYLNQIFIGMFRPDGTDNPRWLGNLKQYQFGVTGTLASPTLFLADSTGAAAISSAGTGFLAPTAVSFWNPAIDTSKLPDSIGGFWVNNPQSAGGGFDNPDGEIVEKGGVGQQIRLANLQDNYTTNPSSPRNLYTCTGTCPTTLGSSLSATPFATTNGSITTAALGITGNSSSVSSISRSGTTVTMALSAAPSPALTAGQAVTVTGAANVELNGTFTITLVDATHFTYPITESPPTPATGTYTASIPSAPISIITLTRTGTTGATASATTATAHGFVVGQTVTISGANGSEFNGAKTIVSVPTSTTFTYTITPGPGTPTAGGTATSGIGLTNPITFTSSQIVPGTINTDATFSELVTIQINTVPSAYKDGTLVNISGVVPGAYNGSYSIAYSDSSGTAKANCPNYDKHVQNFCYRVNTSPTFADTGTTKTADPSASVAISGLTHTASCTGATPSPNVTVTATTSSTLPASFATGTTVTVSGTQGAREAKYVGSFAITKISSTSFSYTSQITTTPPCSPSASGVSVLTSASSIGLASLINWVRGDDLLGDELSPDPGVITVRPSVHGDALHSRPTVVNYGGGSAGPGIVVFYGSNDGVYRAANGNQPLNGSISIGSTPPGGELWGFIPTEFFPTLKRLYANSPMVQLATTPSGLNPTPTPKDYYFDGSTGVYQDPTTTPQTVTLFLSARRGGRLLYALNVNDPTTPKFLWKKTNSDIAELGYTWSTPKAARLRGYANPVVIMGGGYDPNEDNEPPTADTMGRGIYILDATNGNVVWKAEFSAGGGTGTCTGNPCTLSDMTYAIPSDVTLVNRDFDTNGYIDRLYAADLGGNIWRVDLEPAGYGVVGALDSSGVATGAANQIGPTTWQVTKFAAVGGSGSTKRKFFFPPDVVPTKTFDMVLDGTGDREHPLIGNSTQSYGIVNRFYGLKDLNVGSGVPAGWSTAGTTPGLNAPIVDATSSTANAAVTGLTDATSAPDTSTTDNGFYVTFMNAGEKAVNQPTTIGGFTYIGTSTPPTAATLACNNLGTARGYQVNFLTGASASVIFANQGLPPSPVAGLVDVVVGGADRLVPFCLGCGNPEGTGADSTSSIGGIKPPIPVPPVRKRLYWYLDKHDN